MNRFVFIAPGRNQVAGYVLCTKPPFYVGEIVKLNPVPFSVLNYVNDKKPLVHAEVHGHSIIIAFAGCLDTYKVHVKGPDWEDVLQKLFNEMADWFYTEKVQFNQKYYKQFKL